MPIEKTETGAVVFTGEAIQLYRLCALRSMLLLEIVGMRRRGPSAYSSLKKQFGLKGSKEKVLAQLETIIEAKKKESL